MKKNIVDNFLLEVFVFGGKNTQKNPDGIGVLKLRKKKKS
jgi:hypothetical protein